MKEKLQALVSPSQSFKAYRGCLHQITGAAVPYLGVYLTDLTFTEDGNKDMVAAREGGKATLINFKKRALVHNVVAELQLYQQGAVYDVTKIEPLHTMLLEVPSISEEALYALSMLREPRGADVSSIV